MGGNLIELEGVIIDHAHNTFRVECEIGGARRIVLARVAGKLYVHHIRLLPGDRVSVEVSPYDLTKGRITFRHK